MILPVTPLRLLFICSQNRLRSPTAEQVFADRPGLETASAGTNRGADNPLSAELVDWADVIFVMEKQHQRKLADNFKAQLRGKRVVCLGIRDDYQFMQPELVDLLEEKVPGTYVEAECRGYGGWSRVIQPF
jgi:predicted protein tyrosine phosphatase